MNILVVDDSAADRLIIQKMLGGYETKTACDGVEAMKLLDSINVDLVILDLNMPNMDGFQVMEAINADERYKDLRVIILTNYDELDNEIKGLKLGAVDYIRKPLNIESLKARIQIHAQLLWAQRILEKKLHETGITYEKIFEQAPIGIAIGQSISVNKAYDKALDAGFVVSINPMYEQITGRTKEELLKTGWAKITHPEDLEKEQIYFKKLQTGEIKNYSMEKRYIRPDGLVVWVDMVVASLEQNDSENANKHICLIQDITKRKFAEAGLIESERAMSVFLSRLPGLAYKCSFERDRTMRFVSAGCLELTGYEPDELINNKIISYNQLIAHEYSEDLWAETIDAVNKKVPFDQEYEIITASGKRKWVMELGQGICDEQGQIDSLEGIILDISDRKEMENNLRYNSEHDANTGLYNRGMLERILKADPRKDKSHKRALVSVNLGAMRMLDRTYGFNYTQDLIKKAVGILNLYCNDDIMLFHTYEYRFVYYIKGYTGIAMLDKFCNAVSQKLEILLTSERIRGCLGVVEIDEDNGRDTDQLLRKLLITSECLNDTDDETIGIFYYNSKLEEQISREEEIKNTLASIAQGKDTERLYLNYQPILDLKTGRISGFEVLARLKSHKLGVVPPFEFIPIAEETKLIIPIGLRIFRQALEFLKKLQSAGFDDVNISVNVSVIQLLKYDFCDTLNTIIQEMGQGLI